MEKFDPTRLLPALLGGLIVGIVLVILSISFAMLVFSGDLSPYAPAGIGLALFTAVVMAGFIALTADASPADDGGGHRGG